MWDATCTDSLADSNSYKGPGEVQNKLTKGNIKISQRFVESVPFGFETFGSFGPKKYFQKRTPAPGDRRSKISSRVYCLSFAIVECGHCRLWRAILLVSWELSPKKRNVIFIIKWTYLKLYYQIERFVAQKWFVKEHRSVEGAQSFDFSNSLLQNIQLEIDVLYTSC